MCYQSMAHFKATRNRENTATMLFLRLSGARGMVVVGLRKASKHPHRVRLGDYVDAMSRKEAIMSNQWEWDDVLDIPEDDVELVDLDTLLIDLSEEQGSDFSRNVLEV